ncbi:hypothetical protein Pse7367_1381 [Thalassoporum mexicanum PCC 7367]|uniref:hypothetical protein n=1 Tax=Thalassoporum mexicanum TaxID=3457544 RepID=UPI00029FAE07|nr:hypothetical protein [Pseudanabaena sp. PCC 7367]AFY69673.1 hypothetical protein Pse7367_1381 [Pseudanabaena sp. PCC 7367]
MNPRQATMQAIEKLDYRVTPGDIAAQSGLNLEIANSQLLSLASDTSAHMQVSEAGDLAFEFDRSFKNTLLARSFKLRLQEWLSKVWKWLFYLFRVSFGILLIVAIVIVVLAIIVAWQVLSRSGDNNNGGGRRRSSRGGGMNFFFFPRFYPWDFWAVFDPNYYRPSRRRVRSAEQDEMGYLESVYSFLFGDGDPNYDLEERKWQSIASIIRKHDGVVTAEQITPFLGDIGFNAEGYEDYMVPVLARFNGQPHVSDEGTLVYSFPELQTVASERKSNSNPKYLQEEKWQFSQASSGKITLIVVMGIAYLIGTVYLGVLLGNPALAGELAGYLGFVESIYGLLLGYAVLFVSIPAVRYVVLQFVNKPIEKRNNLRYARYQKLIDPAPEVQQKLEFAQQFAKQQQIVGAEGIAYDTKQELLAQEFNQLLNGSGTTED